KAATPPIACLRCRKSPPIDRRICRSTGSRRPSNYRASSGSLTDAGTRPPPPHPSSASNSNLPRFFPSSALRSDSTMATTIAKIRATPVTVPLEAPLLHSNGAHWGRFVRTIVEVETNDGYVGLGEMGGGGEDATRAFSALESYLRGHDVFR